MHITLLNSRLTVNITLLLVLLITSRCNTEPINDISIKNISLKNTSQNNLEVSIPTYSNSKIIRVTTLNPEGEGSLKAALATKGPRVIVFEVGGVIDLNRNSLAIFEPYVVIAGQTAPSPGITIIRGSFKIRTHDVFVQHLSFRPGDTGAAVRSGWSPDGIDIYGGDCYRIGIDHCSISWGVDENIGISGPTTGDPSQTSRRITISNSIIAEGLRTSSHPKGNHSKGIIVHDYSRNISIFGSFFANNEARNPLFKAFTTGIFINNIIYNPVEAGIHLDYSNSQFENIGITPRGPQISAIGNAMYHGLDTPNDLPLIRKKGEVYMSDNKIYRLNDAIIDTLISDDDAIKLLNEEPLSTSIQPLNTKELAHYVIRNVGPRPNDRNKVDRRIISDFLKREGRIIDSQEDVGGYPNDIATSRALGNIPSTKEELQRWLTEMSEALIR